MRRITVLLLAAFIVFSLCSCGDKTELDNTESTTEYAPVINTDNVVTVADEDLPLWETRDMEDGTVYIYKYNGKNATLTIPETIDGKNVTGIFGEAFSNTDIVKNISLPNTLKTISSKAFFECKSLETVNMPDTLTFIGDYAFCNCTHLKEIILPRDLEHIGVTAFDGCSSLSKVVFNGEKLKSISQYAFCGTAITELHIPYGVTKLDFYVNDSKSIDVYIPDTCTDFDSPFASGEGVVIHGISGSEAEIYATQNGNTFVSDYK